MQDKKTKNPQQPEQQQVPSSIPINQTKTMTAAQSGQEANRSMQEAEETALPTLDTLKRQEQRAIDQTAQLGQAAPIMQDLVNEMLEAKIQAAPYEERKAKVQRNLQKKTLTEYMNEGLSLDQAIQFLSEDVADGGARMSFYEAKKQEELAAADERVKSIADVLNARLSALGLQVQQIGQQKNFLQAEDQFNQQMALQRAAAGGGGGGGGGDAAASDAAMYYADLISKGEITSISQVPSDIRDSVVTLMSTYGISAPEEVGVYPSYNQWLGQNYSNMSVDPNSPELQKQYQQQAQAAQAARNNSILQTLGIFGGVSGMTPQTNAPTGAPVNTNPMAGTIPEDENF